MDTIILHFTPTEGDFIRATLDLQRKKGKAFLVYAAYLLLAVFIVLYFILQRGLAGNLLAWLPILLLIVVFLYGVLYAEPQRLKKQIRSNEQLLRPTTWELDDQGLIIKNELEQVRYSWRDFHEVYETAEYFYIILMGKHKQFLFFPKRSFESPQQLELFQNLSQKKILSQEN